MTMTEFQSGIDFTSITNANVEECRIGGAPCACHIHYRHDGLPMRLILEGRSWQSLWDCLPESLKASTPTPDAVIDDGDRECKGESMESLNVLLRAIMGC